MSDIINPVLQEWVMTLKWKDQTGLISAIRGIDMIGIDPTEIEVSNKCKSITKMIRFLVLNNADSRTNFMTDKVIILDKLVDNLLYLHKQVSLGILSNHWFDHILLAIKSIRAFHPNPYTRMYWDTVYTKYNTVPTPNAERVVLEENDITDDNITELKDILSLIDGDNSGVLEESSDDKLAIDCIKPTKSKKSKPIIKSILDTKNEYPNIDGENPIVSDTTDRENYTIHQLEVMRVIDGRAVTYKCINTVKSTQLIFRDMIKVLSQLDAILTNNWDVVNDTMSANYDLSMPISKGTDMRVRDSNTNEFMVSNLTGELLYKDALGVLWVIASELISKDYLYISITRWLGDIDTVVSCLKGCDMSDYGTGDELTDEDKGE